MKLRIQYNPNRNKYIIQEKCLIFWCDRGKFWDDGSVSELVEYYNTEEEAKKVLINALEIKIKIDKIKEQRKKFNAGYQPIIITTEDIKAKYPEYFL
jgi:hypothetical protein